MILQIINDSIPPALELVNKTVSSNRETIFGVLGLLLLIGKSLYTDWVNNKKNKELKTEMSSRDIRVMQKLEENASQIVEIRLEQKQQRVLLEQHIVDNKFPSTFKFNLLESADRRVLMHGGVSKEHKEAIEFWVNAIYDFAILYQDCPFRGKKDIESIEKLENFVRTNLYKKIGALNNFLMDKITEPKNFKNKTFYFYKFIEANNREENIMPIHNITEVLINDLAKNGLNQNQMMELFMRYIKEFITRYLLKLDMWTGKDLKLYE